MATADDASINIALRLIDKLTAPMQQSMRDAERHTAALNAAVESTNRAFTAMKTIVAGVGVQRVFETGLRAVENYSLQVASLTSFITTFSEKAAQGDLAAGFREAHAYAERLVPALEMIDNRSIAAGKDLNVMAETMIQNGVLLDIDNNKQVEGFLNISNALALVTAGQNKDIQFRQEINALLQGQIRATDRLPKLLANIDPLLEEHLKLWKEQGTTIEHVGAMLDGFAASSDLIEKTWAAVGSSLETVRDRVLRDGFRPAYEDLLSTANLIRDSLVAAEGHLTPLARQIQQNIGEAWHTIKLIGMDVEAEFLRVAMLLDKIGGTATSAKMLLFGPGSALGNQNSRTQFEAAAQANMDYEARYYESERRLQELANRYNDLESKPFKLPAAASAGAGAPVIKPVIDGDAAKKATDEAEKAAKAYAKSLDDVLARLQPLRQEQIEFNKDMGLLEALYNSGRLSLFDYIDAENNLILSTTEGKEATQAHTDALKALATAQDAAFNFYTKNVTDAYDFEKQMTMAGLTQAEQVTAKREEENYLLREKAYLLQLTGAISDETYNTYLANIDKKIAAEQAADQDNILQDKMTLYKDLAGFEDEYRSVQLEWIKKIEQAEIAAGMNAAAAHQKATDSIAKIDQANFEAKSGQVASALGDMQSTFQTIGGMYDQSSADYAHMQEAAKAMIVLQQAVAVANAVAAIANQGLGDPYTAFARIAAMMAAMGSLLGSAGIGFGGGSADAPPVNPLAGTVFGDPTATSDSATAVLDLLADIHAEEYAQLRGINQGVQGLNQNISGLVNSIIRNTGALGASIPAGALGDQLGAAHGLYGNVQGVAGLAGGMGAVVGAGVMANMYNLTALGGPALWAIAAGLNLAFPKIGEWVGELLGDAINTVFGGDSTSYAIGKGISFTGKSTAPPGASGLMGMLGQLFGSQQTAANWTLGSIKAGDIPVRSYAKVQTDTDGGWFGSDSSSVATYFSALDATTARMFNMVLDNLSTSLYELGEVFGVSSATIDQYSLKLGAINLSGLNGEEINTKLVEYFSAIGDTAAEALYGSRIDKYRQVGEGALETASRLMIDQAVVMSILSTTGQHLRGDLIAASEAMITMAGGLDKLQEAAGSYYDKFFSESEKQADLQASLAEQIKAATGSALPGSREAYRALAEGMKLTTAAGQEGYVTLMRLAGAADQYYGYLEDAAQDALRRAEQNLRQAYQTEQAGIQKTIDQFSRFSASLHDFQESLGMGNLSTLSLDDRYRQASTQFAAISRQARLGDVEAIGQLQGVSQSFLAASREYSTSAAAYGVDFSAVQAAIDQTITVADRQQDIATRQLDALTSQVDALITINTSVLSVREAIAALSQAKLPTVGATSALALNGIPKYAEGGYFPGGLRIVGERGPELEATGPSRIFKNGANFKMDTAALEARLDSVVRELVSLRFDLTKQTKKSADMLEKIDALGLGVRAA